LRREFLRAAAGAGAGLCLADSASGSLAAKLHESHRTERVDKQALIAITLDLEMSRNFPTWETTHWDYEKGNLDEPTKRYAVEAARQIKERGGVIHFFAVGRVLEQENVDWLKEIVAAGHPVGNHTYDHVYLLASEPDQLQFRFQRAPWLIAGKTTGEVIHENIRLTDIALRKRVGVKSAGFRTPGGFQDGLSGREDLQRMLLSLGFDWVSSKYPAHANTEAHGIPGEEVYQSIVAAQQFAQPFVYPSGLVEIPMSPISDIGAFRTGRWELEYFLEAIRRGVEWAIETGGVYDFLSHPSCLLVTDPKFKAIELIADLVEQAGDRARIVDLGTIARQVKQRDRA